MRKINFNTNYAYHIYGRGVEKRKIFLDLNDYSRFVSILKHYLNFDYPYSSLKQRLKKAQTPKDKQKVILYLETRRIQPPVEIISFCLMPNHYHLTFKQLVENGITQFMHRIGTAYTGYFNIRQDRSGRLFESTFKAVAVDSDEQLLHLTRYQHLNPHKLGFISPKQLTNYDWSSLSTYLGSKKFSFVNHDLVLANFKNPKSYLDFVLAELDEFEPLRLEEITIDDDFGWFAKYRSLEKDRRNELRNQYLESLS